MSQDPLRRKIVRISAIAGGASAAAAFVPFLGQLAIRKLSPPAGAVVDVKLDGIVPMQLLTVDWQGQPVWILRRTPAMLASLPALREQLADADSEHSTQPPYCRNEARALKPEWFVAFGLCTHLGCAPTARFQPGSAEGMPADWRGGFVCPCHTSTFDLAGRAFKNREAKLNLAVPPYRFVDAATLRIGEHHHDA
jgi:ubiquinol-cytochrome c reductase iron-sulfur subunit